MGVIVFYKKFFVWIEPGFTAKITWLILRGRTFILTDIEVL